MNNEIGYKDKAVLFSLDDIELQVIKCKTNSKRFVTSSFMGSGKATQGQTLEISTKARLKPTIQAGQCRCLYDGVIYLVVGVFPQKTAPIHNKTRQIKTTILSLQ